MKKVTMRKNNGKIGTVVFTNSTMPNVAKKRVKNKEKCPTDVITSNNTFRLFGISMAILIMLIGGSLQETIYVNLRYILGFVFGFIATIVLYTYFGRE